MIPLIVLSCWIDTIFPRMLGFVISACGEHVCQSIGGLSTGWSRETGFRSHLVNGNDGRGDTDAEAADYSSSDEASHVRSNGHDDAADDPDPAGQDHAHPATELVGEV